MPVFDLQGGLPLSAVRAASVCALLSVFGALVFRVLVAPRAFARMATDEIDTCRPVLHALVQASAAVGLAANLAWLCVQAANMAEAPTLFAALGAVTQVATDTVFGRVLLAQTLCLAGVMGVLGMRDSAWRQRGALGLATLALCLQAEHGHAYSMYDGPSLLLACDVLHLLGAGAWLGGLLPLLMMVRHAPPRAGAIAARWFSPLGQGCIAALVVSAAWQGWVLIGTVPGLVGTGYGWMGLGKLALFGVLLGFACVNRYRFAPALLGGERDRARRVLLRSLVLQTGAAVAIVLAAAVLSGLPPAMHEQPVWPFAQRFSLDAINEDPEFRREVALAGAALGGAAVLVAAAFILRRRRAIACVMATVMAWFALPHLDLLFVPAYRTSFFRSPSGFAAASIVAGADIYARHCASCHGADGRGDHPAMAGLTVPPADLTAPHLWMHSDGELFWWLSRGITTPEGAQAMPGFAGVLDEDQLWAVLDFIRARNAGVARRANGSWTHMIQAPDFAATCGETTPRLSDMRGHFVRLRIGGMATPPAPGGEALTIVAGPVRSAPPPGLCFTVDEAVLPAYRIVSDLDAADLPGSEFLIDGGGWLRAMQPASRQDWSSPALLAATISALRAQKAGADAPMRMPM